MNFQDTQEALRILQGKLCAAMRRGEILWYSLASDYQSKYAFSADYDKAFKRQYYERATACREIAEQLEALALPAVPEDVAPFVAALKSGIERCPRAPNMQGQLESLAGEIEKMLDF